MKKVTVLFSLVMILLSVGISNASLTTIGTVIYKGMTCNLVYEDDSIVGGLVWLDHNNSNPEGNSWLQQDDWASGLSFTEPEINLFSGFTTNIDWSTGWRLPLTYDTAGGYNQTGSEMGHLFYESLGNVAYGEPTFGWPNFGDFYFLHTGVYWSGTEAGGTGVWNDPFTAWRFNFYTGDQSYGDQKHNQSAMAVRPGQVSGGSIPPVPIPSAIWLLGSGLIGLAGFRRKFRKA